LTKLFRTKRDCAAESWKVENTGQKAENEKVGRRQNEKI